MKPPNETPPEECPDPSVHGNPFRYCPTCTWREEPDLKATADTHLRWLLDNDYLVKTGQDDQGVYYQAPPGTICRDWDRVEVRRRPPEERMF